MPETWAAGEKRTVGSVERCFGIGADVLPCYPLGKSNDPRRTGFIKLMTLQCRLICRSVYPTLWQCPFGEKCVLRQQHRSMLLAKCWPPRHQHSLRWLLTHTTGVCNPVCNLTGRLISCSIAVRRHYSDDAIACVFVGPSCARIPPRALHARIASRTFGVCMPA